MCRHLGWLGASRTLASLVSEPEWSLVRQAYQPRRQSHGLINADGFGIGWYDRDVRAEPAVLRRDRPIWGDGSLASVGGLVRSGSFVAAVRSATAGMAVEESSTAPFCRGRWLVSHNGLVSTEAAGALLPEGVVPDSACDSSILAAVLFSRLAAGVPLAQATGAVVRELAAADPGARLNLLVSDGVVVAATAWGASLCWLAGTGLATGGVLVASEPLDDDPHWVEVDDRSLLVAGPDGAVVSDLTRET